MKLIEAERNAGMAMEKDDDKIPIIGAKRYGNMPWMMEYPDNDWTDEQINMALGLPAPIIETLSEEEERLDRGRATATSMVSLCEEV